MNPSIFGEFLEILSKTSRCARATKARVCKKKIFHDRCATIKFSRGEFEYSIIYIMSSVDRT